MVVNLLLCFMFISRPTFIYVYFVLYLYIYSKDHFTELISADAIDDCFEEQLQLQISHLTVVVVFGVGRCLDEVVTAWQLKQRPNTGHCEIFDVIVSLNRQRNEICDHPYEPQHE